MQPIVPTVFRTGDPVTDRNLDEIWKTFRRLCAAIDSDDHKVSVDSTDDDADGYDFLNSKVLVDATMTKTVAADHSTITLSASPGPGPTVYDMPISIPGALTSSGKLWRFKCVRGIVLPEDAAGSYGNAGTAAFANSTITLKKTTAAGVTTDIGTVTVAAGATAAVFTVAAAVSFAADDVFWGLNQSIADAYLADLALTFKMEYA